MADPSNPGDDGSVGYRRPPKQHQFRKGKSGNPKGRSKGSSNFGTHVSKALSEKVVVVENGVRRRVSKREAAAKQLVNKAASGDFKATNLLLKQEPLDQPSHERPAPDAFDAADLKTLELAIDRIRRSQAAETVEKPAVGAASASLNSFEESDSNASHDPV